MRSILLTSKSEVNSRYEMISNTGNNFLFFLHVFNSLRLITSRDSSLFRSDFIFSASTSSYQIEGAWNTDGKGESIWDNLTHTRPYLTLNRDNGDIASDSYRLYKEDIKLLKNTGFQMYRFSISWTRVLPRGDLSEINEIGVRHYHDFIDELISAGIQPMITIYHWDLPQKFQDEGGWLNASIVDHLEKYANFLFAEYGNKVKWWITINEPDNIVKGYTTETKAPALNLGELSPAAFLVAHHTLLAHGRIFRLYDKTYRPAQKGKISLALSGQYHQAMTNSIRDVKAAEHTMTMSFDWYAHPIYSKHGGYPDNLRKYVAYKCQMENCETPILPKFSSAETHMLRGSFDFFGLNHYTSFFSFRVRSNGSYISRSEYDVERKQNPYWPRSSLSWLKIFPQGFLLMLRWIKYRYNNPAIFVTENGYCDHGQINDTMRVCYHQHYLEQMINAMRLYKINVIGYSVWSFVDTFEWTYGYKPRFGLVHIDFDDANRTRTPKYSLEFFRQLIRDRETSECSRRGRNFSESVYRYTHFDGIS